MRYLVEGEFVDSGPVVSPQQFGQLADVVGSSLDMLAKLEGEKRIRGGALTGARVGVFVTDAESHEEVGDLLRSLPFWGLHRWEVTPLESWEHRARQDRQLLERLKAGPR
ncbi:MAG: hypothetical protein ACE5JI_13535 [Acidobacteriota bacterium]